MKIIPPGMNFERALRAGLVGRIECRPYIAWLKTLPCDRCGKTPSDPSHLDNYFKGMGTKLPDLWAIPECRECHEKYERTPPQKLYAQVGEQVLAINTPIERLSRAALYLVHAFALGLLKWAPDRAPRKRRTMRLTKASPF